MRRYQNGDAVLYVATGDIYEVIDTGQDGDIYYTCRNQLGGKRYFRASQLRKVPEDTTTEKKHFQMLGG